MTNRFFLFACCFFIASQVRAQSPKIHVVDRKLTSVRLVLNWVPEPEFGGFYAAQVLGLYEKNGLKVEILPGGAGTPTVQMLGAGKIEFAVTSGSEIVVARSRGSDVVAVHSSFDISPMGVMVHKSQKLKSLDELFSREGFTLALQKGQGFVDYLEKKFGFSKVKIVPYTGGIANFLKDQHFAQQGFIFSEPLSAKREGAVPDFFLLSSVGYNPYTEVMAVRGDYLKSNTEVVKQMVTAVREGWEAYVKDPQATNKLMGDLNKAMDAQTFVEAALVQKPLLGDGKMTETRWTEHIQQLMDSKTITKAPAAAECFRNF